MKKTIITIAFALIMLSVAVPTFAATSVKVTIPSFDVTLNGQKMDNRSSEYPLIVHNDITYIPMTWNLTHFMGLKTRFGKRYEDLPNSTEIAFFIGNSGEMVDELIPDKAHTANDAPSYTALIADYEIWVNDIRDEKMLDNSAEEYPILNFRDITYFPLTWRFAHDSFGWDYSFDTENGLVLDSKNAFRPVWDESKIFSRGMMANTYKTYYVYNDDAYVGFHPNTYGDQADLIWNSRDNGKVTIILYGVFFNEIPLNEDTWRYFDQERPKHNYADILYLNSEINPLRPSSVEPRLEGDMFYIRCLGEGPSENGVSSYITYDMEMDLPNGNIIRMYEVSFDENGAETGRTLVEPLLLDK